MCTLARLLNSSMQVSYAQLPQVPYEHPMLLAVSIRPTFIIAVAWMARVPQRDATEG